MSIETQLEELNQIKTNIFTSIGNKGVIIPENPGLKDAAGLIDSIPTSDGENTIKIGAHYYKYALMPDGKKWLAENLDYIFPTLIVGTSGQSSSPQANYYNNSQTIYTVHGGTRPTGLLYNKKAVDYLVANPSLIQGCHIPTTTEWQELFSSIGTDSVAAQKLKTQNNYYGDWPISWNGTDEYGFNMLPAGRYDGSSFGLNEAIFRTASDTYVEIRDDNQIYMYGGNTGYGYSLRLIVD